LLFFSLIFLSVLCAELSCMATRQLFTAREIGYSISYRIVSYRIIQRATETTYFFADGSMFNQFLLELISPVERVLFELLHVVHLLLDRRHRVECRQRHSTYTVPQKLRLIFVQYNTYTIK